MVVAAPDAATLARFRSGDGDAVRSLYDLYGRLVFTIAVRILGDRGQAEEAVQHTFVQAWRAASTFEDGRDPAPWLATIARRAAIDIQRRERRRPADALDDANPGDGALVTMPPSEEQAWEAWQVRAAIEELAPDEREIIRLQHLEGYTQSEIAERLGIALGTVKSRSFRAHKQLAARLAHLRAVDEP
jgi:RNA polymerase sigma factor (sigma-70 family)